MRYALSDQQWMLISDFLPANGNRGNQWKDHRTVINGILWILRTGAPWRDLPDKYGCWKTVYERFRLWTQNKTWDVILYKLLGIKNQEGNVDWQLFCIDGSSVRAHKSAAGAGKKSPKNEPEDHSLGRSRGGFGTKIHLVCDSRGLPVAVDISAGQTHEANYCLRIIDSIEVASRHGRPRKRPEKLAGDKGYTSVKIRRELKSRNIIPVIPTRNNQCQDRKFDKKSYRKRNIIERCIGWIKESRRIATRYEKLSVHYLGMLKIAMILAYLRAS